MKWGTTFEANCIMYPEERLTRLIVLNQPGSEGCNEKPVKIMIIIARGLRRISIVGIVRWFGVAVSNGGRGCNLGLTWPTSKQ